MSSKYNVSSNQTARTFNGVVYDSAVEMRYMRDYLTPLLKSGDIQSVQRQVKYDLQPSFKHKEVTYRAITYVADFVVTHLDGHIEIIDIKGMPDSVAKLKKKLFLYRYPDMDYKWIAWSAIDGGWIEYEALKIKRKERKLARKKKKQEQEAQLQQKGILNHE